MDDAPSPNRVEAEMNRIYPTQFALATTFAILVLYTLCALAVAAFPDGTVNFVNAWFHSLDLNLLRPPGGRPLTWSQYGLGFLAVIVVAFPSAFVLAASYNLLVRGKARSVTNGLSRARTAGMA